ncbi:SH3-containing GRB2-like protein 3-interacting protein 1 [Varanus komodoensis]|nr:SH3-containing GRB2-like protein 3-interacting protein 1 [Varanus komodoensis]
MLIKFAEDTKIGTVATTEEQVLQIQKDLDKLWKWARDNRMVFTADKYTNLHLEHRNKCHSSIGPYQGPIRPSGTDIILRRGDMPLVQSLTAPTFPSRLVNTPHHETGSELVLWTPHPFVCRPCPNPLDNTSVYPKTPQFLNQDIMQHFVKGLAEIQSDCVPLVAGSSRGPSPLTMGAQDTLPVAAAFTETVNAYFKGADPNNCIVKITGEMVLSFPAGITRHFANNPAPAVLTFRVTNYNRLEHVLPNPQLLCCDSTQVDANTKEFWVNMLNLMNHLKKVSEQKPQATYYNVDMLKYQVSAQGIQSTPLNLAVNWRCDPTSTDLRIDYKYNIEAMTTPVALNNVQFLVPIDGGVTKLQAVLPPAIWYEDLILDLALFSLLWNTEQQRILWRIPDISQKSENGGLGLILFNLFISDLEEGATSPLTKFTDNTKVGVLATSEEQVIHIQKDLDRLWKCSEDNRVAFNVDKFPLDNILAEFHSEGVGSLLARFQLSEGPSKPSTLVVQFTSEGSTLSSCDIELVGAGYRFSLIKKRFAAGKYLADN